MNPITFQPRKPPHRRRKPSSIASPPPAPPATVTVLQVIRGGLDTLVWTFSSNCTLSGESCPQLQADDGEGWRSPSSAEQTGPDEVTAFYEGETFDDSSPWQVVEEPVGVTFAGGSLIVPEAGVVIVV